jgi:putative addiction module killer protein
MVEILETIEFRNWLNALRDNVGKVKIAARIQRLKFGNSGDVAPVGSGVSELRIHSGPGYRLYFCQRGNEIIILLCGGDKASQSRDIQAALRLAQNLKVEKS